MLYARGSFPGLNAYHKYVPLGGKTQAQSTSGNTHVWIPGARGLVTFRWDKVDGLFWTWASGRCSAELTTCLLAAACRLPLTNRLVLGIDWERVDRVEIEWDGANERCGLDRYPYVPRRGPAMVTIGRSSTDLINHMRDRGWGRFLFSWDGQLCSTGWSHTLGIGSSQSIYLRPATVSCT